MTEPIRVFLCDDHEMVRRGVKDMLEADGRVTVIGEASNVAEALARVPALRPDVAVLDVQMPDGNGVELCRDLKSEMPDLKCLILTSFDDEQAMMGAIMAGAAGFVLKQIRGTDLVGAVHTVAAGGSLLDPAAVARLMNHLREKSTEKDPLTELTEQERKVLDLIAEGLTNRQIGERLFLAEKTVKNYVSSVLAKLGLERRTQAALLAQQLRNNS